MKATLIMVSLVLLSVASSLALEPGDIAERSRASGVCLLHHVRLVDGTAYDYSGHDIVAIDISNKGAAVYDKYPNAIYPVYRRKPERDWTKPISVRYCPVCERKLTKELAK